MRWSTYLGSLGPLKLISCCLLTHLLACPVQCGGFPGAEPTAPACAPHSLQWVSALYPHLRLLIRSNTLSQFPRHLWRLGACTEPHTLPEGYEQKAKGEARLATHVSSSLC